jgi:hypothetical protein
MLTTIVTKVVHVKPLPIKEIDPQTACRSTNFRHKARQILDLYDAISDKVPNYHMLSRNFQYTDAKSGIYEMKLPEFHKEIDNITEMYGTKFLSGLCENSEKQLCAYWLTSNTKGNSSDEENSLESVDEFHFDINNNIIHFIRIF